MMYLGKDFKPNNDCLLSLLKKTGDAMEKSYQHKPLPPVAEINCPSTLDELNSSLASSHFLSASYATKVDVVTFESLVEQPSHWTHPHLSRWFHLMNAMTLEERQALPGGLGILPPRAAPLMPMDRWILSRLAQVVDACNDGFATYNFPQITTSLYNFWLYELCDVYLEYLKPVFHGADASAAVTARNVLYTCLDAGLRLISPFMPFISEELFQRLPRRSAGDPPSIIVTRYPEGSDFPYKDSIVEAEVELVQTIVSGVRSARADYNLPNKVKTDLSLCMFDGKLSRQLEGYAGVIGTLAYCSNVEVTSSPPQSGCAIITISDKCVAHILLSGLINSKKEEEKLAKKRGQLRVQLEKLEGKAKAPSYEKVPEEVRKTNEEKVAQTETEIQRLGEAILALKGL